MHTDYPSLRDTLTSLFPLLETGLLERQRELRMSLLAALAGESVFLQGRPGTAKSLLARRLQTAFSGARCFDYLMGRFSTPEELFGPLSIKALKDDDRLVRRTSGYLPEADIVFLDEIWKASPPIQNILLTALNEKIFRNGDQEFRLPMKLLMAASNEGPPDEASWAFWDRFLIRLHVVPLVGEENVRRLLSDNTDPYLSEVPEDKRISQENWQAWTRLKDRVESGPDTLDLLVWMRAELGRLHAAGQAPYISDRRWKKAAGLIRTCAATHDRQQTWLGDTWVVVHTLWDKAEEFDLVVDVWHRGLESLGGGTVLESLRTAASGFLDSQAGLGKEEIEAEIDTPEMVDGEYLVLDVAGESRQLRVWQDDLLPLVRKSGEGRVEVFFYRQGAFLESRELACRVSNWEVEFFKGLDEGAREDAKAVSARIRTRKTLGKVTRQATPDPQAAKRRTDQLAALDTGLAEARDRLLAELAGSGDLARDHFFLPPQEADRVSTVSRRRLEDLARLEALVHGIA